MYCAVFFWKQSVAVSSQQAAGSFFAFLIPQGQPLAACIRR